MYKTDYGIGYLELVKIIDMINKNKHTLIGFTEGANSRYTVIYKENAQEIY